MEAILAEADCLCTIHARMCERLKSGEFQEIKHWQERFVTPVITYNNKRENLYSSSRMIVLDLRNI